MQRVVSLVGDGGNPSDRKAVPLGDEKLYFRVFIKRVLCRIEDFSPVKKQRRHPMSVVLVKRPLEFDERFPLGSCRQRAY